MIQPLHKPMKVYITQVGTSVEAVINSLWMNAFKNGYFPDKIYLLWNEEIGQYKKAVVEALKILSKEYGFNTDIDDSIEFSEDDVEDFAKKHENAIKSELTAGNEVIVDTTPGRKYMSGISMKNIAEFDIEGHYLHLKNPNDFRSSWLPEIPIVLQNLVDIKEPGKNVTSFSHNYIKSGTTERDIELSRKELMIVLNNLLMQGQDEFVISTGKDNEIDLCKITTNNKEDICKIEIKAPKNKDLGEKIGNTDKLRTLMQFAGIYEMVAPGRNNSLDQDLNEHDFFEKITEDLKDWLQSTYISYDTNAFLSGLPEKFERYREKYYPSVKPNYLIIGAVENELTDEKGKLPYDDNDRVYSNQPTPKDRMFKLGWSQLKLLQDLNAETIPSHSSGDHAIKQNLQYFLKSSNKKVILITADNNFHASISRTGGQNIKPYYVKYGYTGNPEASWDNICSLIYALSSYFGRINISGVGNVMGVWQGKPGTDWYDGYMMIDDLDHMVINAIQACRKLSTYCSSKRIHRR